MKIVQIMQRAIKDSELHGYKWTAHKEGLQWEYGDNFLLTYNKEMVQFESPTTGVYVYVGIVSKEKDIWLCDKYHDFVKTQEEAIYWATRKMIAKANYLY